MSRFDGKFKSLHADGQCKAMGLDYAQAESHFDGESKSPRANGQCKAMARSFPISVDEDFVVTTLVLQCKVWT